VGGQGAIRGIGSDGLIRALEHTFNHAGATNDVDTCFGFYTEDATLFFYGESQPIAHYSILITTRGGE
jgi:hypothetical protein